MVVLLYIAKPKNEKLVLQRDEIENVKWCSYDEALNTLTFDNWKEMLKLLMI